MPAIWAAAIGAGAGLAGDVMNSKAGISLKTLRRRGRQGMAEARSRDQLFGNLEEAELKSAHKKELGGFGGARNALDAGAALARKNIIQRGSQNAANVEQSVLSRGLQGTSAGTNQLAGVGDMTTQQLAQIDMQLAQAFAQLGLDESSLMGQQGRELTGLAGKRRAHEQELSEANFGLLTAG